MAFVGCLDEHGTLRQHWLPVCITLSWSSWTRHKLLASLSCSACGRHHLCTLFTWEERHGMTSPAYAAALQAQAPWLHKLLKAARRLHVMFVLRDAQKD